MNVDVPTPSDGEKSIHFRRSRNGRSMAIVVPMAGIGAGVIAALAWAWTIDRNEALTSQRVEDHERFIRRFEDKLDNLRDLIIHRTRQGNDQ